MSVKWRPVGPTGLEVILVNGAVGRVFGLLMLLAGLALLFASVGGQLRKPDGLSLDGNFLGVLAFALAFVTTGAWLAAYRGIRRLDTTADTYEESGSVLGIGRGRRRRLSDFRRIILVRKPPVTSTGSRVIDYDLVLFASRNDWTVLLTTSHVNEAGALGRAVGELIGCRVEELSRKRWDELAA